MSALSKIHDQPIHAEHFSLGSQYLMNVARARAELDAGVQNVAFSAIDQLVHFTFQYIFMIFYPSYDRFYYERQVIAFRNTGRHLPAYESCGLREAVLFIHRFLHSPIDIGSIVPSSHELINAMTKKVREAALKPEPQRYLEIGAGTGSFTEEIIRQMKDTDHLDVVEYDPDFCYLLQRKFRHLHNVTIHSVSIFDYNAMPYDAVVSGLPLTGFPPDLVRRGHQKYIDLTKPGGFFSYFEYIALPSIKQAVLWGKLAEDFASVRAQKAALVEEYGDEIDEAWWNMPPARAFHCNKPIPS
jgi:phospholipid N-methyltransferase